MKKLLILALILGACKTTKTTIEPVKVQKYYRFAVIDRDSSVVYTQIQTIK